MRKLNKGFTLVELLVVIAIIGILASVVLVSLNSARTRARDARRVSDVHQLSLALEGYYDAGIGSSDTDTTGNDYPVTLSRLATKGYIGGIPKDPNDSTDYKYAALGAGTVCSSYHLGANLEDSAHKALSGDADAVAGTICTGGGTDFAGTDPIYDVKP